MTLKKLMLQNFVVEKLQYGTKYNNQEFEATRVYAKLFNHVRATRNHVRKSPLY